MKIYFLASGEIAVPVLRRLAGSSEVELVGCGTQPDHPAGRRRRLTPTPFGAAAAELGLPLDKIPDVNTPDFLEALSAKQPEIVLVFSFGQLLREQLLALPGATCVNIHASLLPRYRGASPVAQAILNGDDRSGVSFIRMVRALDAGPVFRSFTLPLSGSETAEELEKRLGELAALHVVEVLGGIVSGEVTAQPQDETIKSICRKLRKEDGRINWHDSAGRIAAMVRAFRPWPGAHCRFVTSRGESSATIWQARVRPELHLEPGTGAVVSRRELCVGCGSGGALEILELAPAGAKPMSAAEFLNGLRGEIPKFPPPEADAG